MPMVAVSWRLGVLLALIGAVVVPGAGCGCGSCDEVVDPNQTGTAPTYAPDFALPDVNLNSPTAGATVGPRQYVSRVSAWYFGQAT